MVCSGVLPRTVPVWRSHRDLAERQSPVDEDASGRGQYRGDALQGSTPLLRMPPVQRPHPDREDDVERFVTGVEYEVLDRDVANTHAT